MINRLYGSNFSSLGLNCSVIRWNTTVIVSFRFSASSGLNILVFLLCTINNRRGQVVLFSQVLLDNFTQSKPERVRLIPPSQYIMCNMRITLKVGQSESKWLKSSWALGKFIHYAVLADLDVAPNEPIFKGSPVSSIRTTKHEPFVLLKILK